MSTPLRQDRAAEWLKKNRLKWMLLRLLGGVALLAAGAIALFVTFWVVYGVCWITLGRLDVGISSQVYSIISGAFLVLLFIGNARTDREYLNEISVTTGTFTDELVILPIPGGGFGSNINPLAPDTLHSGVKMITRALFCGPRAVVAAVRMFRKAYRLARLDVPGCAAVIAFLHAHPGRVPYGDLIRALPTLDRAKVLPQLGNINGIVFLGNEPMGLMLSSEATAEVSRSVT